MRARLETEWPDGDVSGAHPQGIAGASAQGFKGQMRTWLRTGARGFVVDPRRRLGKHGGARKMLAADGENGSGRTGGWQGLVAALQRHTVHGELAQLSNDDRHILSLAYLSGHTNREIAAMMQVSVRTVSRRLSSALARFEESLRKTGVWIVSALLFALAGYERLASFLRHNRWSSTAALVAAGTAATVAVTLVVAPPAMSGAKPSTGSPQVHSLRLLPPGEQPSAVVVSNLPLNLSVIQTIEKAIGSLKQDVPDPVVTATRICHGNPTSAAPPTPVGPRGTGPHRPPVTLPGPGGCGHLNK